MTVDEAVKMSDILMQDSITYEIDDILPQNMDCAIAIRDRLVEILLRRTMDRKSPMVNLLKLNPIERRRTMERVIGGFYSELPWERSDNTTWFYHSYEVIDDGWGNYYNNFPHSLINIDTVAGILNRQYQDYGEIKNLTLKDFREMCEYEYECEDEDFTSYESTFIRIISTINKKTPPSEELACWTEFISQKYFKGNISPRVITDNLGYFLPLFASGGYDRIVTTVGCMELGNYWQIRDSLPDTVYKKALEKALYVFEGPLTVWIEDPRCLSDNGMGAITFPILFCDNPYEMLEATMNPMWKISCCVIDTLLPVVLEGAVF